MSPDALDPAAIAAVITRRHGNRLRALHRQLFSAAGEFDPDLTPDGWRPPSLQAPAITNPHARVSVAASIQTRLEEPADLPAGTRLLQVSVAGHHRLLHQRAALIRAEEDAWAHAVVGPKWVTRAYRQGVVASVGGGPGATHYVVYLDASGEAQPGPLTPAQPLVPLVAA